jgi:hypothetical protein
LVVLQALYRDGVLRAPGFEKIDVKIDVPDQYNEKQLMRNTLELVEVVLSDEERTVFMSEGATDEDLERVGKSIENKCLKKNSRV